MADAPSPSSIVPPPATKATLSTPPPVASPPPPPNSSEISPSSNATSPPAAPSGSPPPPSFSTVSPLPAAQSKPPPPPRPSIPSVPVPPQSSPTEPGASPPASPVAPSPPSPQSSPPSSALPPATSSPSPPVSPRISDSTPPPSSSTHPPATVLSPPPPARSAPPSLASPEPPAAATPSIPPILSPAPPSSNVSLSPPPPPDNSPSPPIAVAPESPTPPSQSKNTPLASPPLSPPIPASPPTPPSSHSTNGSSSAPPLPSPTTNNPTTAAPSPNATTSATSTNSGGIKTGAAIATGVVVSILVLSLIGITIWVVKKRRKSGAGSKVGYTMPSPFGSSENSGPLVRAGSYGEFMCSPSEPGAVGNPRSCFTYKELIEATKGFSVDNLLGEGGFGSVYKGCLADGREVAVKQLKIGGGQGEREFRAEVEIISRVHHRHLVSLVGYCVSEHRRLLVYDYVPNNTLDYHLHGENRPPMDWATRFRVAAGAAHGIAYLHEDCHPRIIHRDIKSSNILLDNSFEAQVSDFGLAKLAADAYTHVTTRVMGTFGYMAPEYASSGKLTEKSDVFSFGVVLLELITGRKPVDASQPLGDESLVEWARPLLTQAVGGQNIEELVDVRLGKNLVGNELRMMMEAAAACVRHSSKRPKMSQVARALDSVIDSSDLSNGMKPGQSEMYGAPNSTQIRVFQRMAFGSGNLSWEFRSSLGD